MRPPLFIACLLLSVWAEATSASWSPFASGRGIATIDFLNARTGLASVPGDKLGALQHFTDTVFSPIANIAADQIVIQDSDRAWVSTGTALYRGTKGWTKWDSVRNIGSLQLLAATPNALFLTANDSLYFIPNGDTLRAATGITHDLITSIDYFSHSLLFAVSATALYESTDSGADWVAIGTHPYSGLFADRAHGYLFTSGDSLRKSVDTGKSWTVLDAAPQLNIGILSGQIFGCHDCSGEFYLGIGNTGANRGNSNVMRSRDGGVTFEVVDGNLGGNSPYDRNWMFDRGAVVYSWTYSSPYNTFILVSHDGIDGVIPDSVTTAISIVADTEFDTICATAEVPLDIRVASSICSEIFLDSVSDIQSAGRIITKFKPLMLAGGDTNIPIEYSGTAAGTDPVTLRLWFHGADVGIREYSDFPLVVNNVAPPAILSSTDSLEFGDVFLLNSKQLTVTIMNSGCSPLRIDSVVSSNPSLFALLQVSPHLTLARDSSVTLPVTFTPQSIGAKLESIEIGTNAGEKFIELFGRGVSPALVSDGKGSTHYTSLRAYPNPASNTIHCEGVTPSSNYEILDLLGRTVSTGSLTGNSIFVGSFTNGIYILRCGGISTHIVIAKP